MSQQDDYLRNLGLAQQQTQQWPPFSNAQQARPQQTFPNYPNPLQSGHIPTPQQAQRKSAMTMKINLGWIFFLAYILGAFGSFGYVWNHSIGLNRCYVDNGVQHDCFTDNNQRAFNAIAIGAFWPIYWGGMAAVNTTK